jgi:hypothetical protein
MVVAPLPITVLGLNTAVTPAGNPLTLKFAVSENPFEPDTVTAYPTLLPRTTVWLDGDDDTAKSGAGAPPTNVAACNSIFPALAAFCVNVTIRICPADAA